MPRNDQITRQWHLLRRLENSNGLTLQQLVQSVPEDFPNNARTVRRDLEALEAVGFPLVTERVNGQSRWRLMEGFRDIPSLGFSATELMALVFSRKLLQPLEGTEIQSALNSDQALVWIPRSSVCQHSHADQDEESGGQRARQNRYRASAHEVERRCRNMNRGNPTSIGA